ncbi:MAG: hypothetical protein ACKVS9_15280 [Phycisphaerae bacterium]
MSPAFRRRFVLTLAPLAGTLAIGGCALNALGNLDILLGLDATANLLALPQSGIFGFVQFLASLLT